MTFIQTFKLWMHLTGFSQNARPRSGFLSVHRSQRQTRQDQVVIELFFIRI